VEAEMRKGNRRGRTAMAMLDSELLNRVIDSFLYEWVPADSPVTLPDFIEGRLKGKMKMIAGKVHIKKLASSSFLPKTNFWAKDVK